MQPLILNDDSSVEEPKFSSFIHLSFIPLSTNVDIHK